MTRTALDIAFQKLNAAPDAARTRMGYFQVFLTTAFVLPLAADQGEVVTPASRFVDGVEFVFAYDGEDRLSEGAEQVVSVTGADLVNMLVPLGVGVLVNPGHATENAVMPDTLNWLTTLSQADASTALTVQRLTPPKGANDKLLMALDQVLSTFSGQAAAGILVGAEDGLILLILDADETRHANLASQISAAVNLADLGDLTLDVGFCAGDDPRVERFGAVGLTFEIPQPKSLDGPTMPGSDPEKPPKLT